MIGIPVLQGYGLTETTGICTLDIPGKAVPGRVGPAIPGIEMILGEDNEILVRGPHIFSGYWRRPEATAKALSGGWFHSGDQWILADHRAAEEPDHPQFRAQYCARTHRRKAAARAACGPAGGAGWK
jgi:acyl-CoA synthetase (AMP-forming)/AMP-acid ligase II